jgi:hypothetical protein
MSKLRMKADTAEQKIPHPFREHAWLVVAGIQGALLGIAAAPKMTYFTPAWVPPLLYSVALLGACAASVNVGRLVRNRQSSL